MRRLTVRLSDEMVEKLEAISKKYGLRDLEETLRFAARFTSLTLDKIEQRRGKPRVLISSEQT